MKYENYVFDLYGTLIDIHTDEEDEKAWEKMTLFYKGQGADYTPEELKESYARLVKEESKKVSEIQVDKVFAQMYAEKGVKADDGLVLDTCHKFREYTTEYIRLYSGAEELLKKLKEAGKNVYLLSNAQRSFTERELEMTGIKSYFDEIFISSDFGVKKPQKEFFQVLMERCGINPAESIMIGNDETCDIQGAQTVGMDTLYIHSNISPEYTGKVNPTYVFSEMPDDLTEIIK